MGEAKKLRTIQWRREQLLKEIDELFEEKKRIREEEKKNEPRASEGK